jgi:uncharacterized membrane-anchored protein YhcB (DUF1043 family)
MLSRRQKSFETGLEEPTLRSVAPEWAELSDKLAELLELERDLETKIAVNQKIINQSGLATFNQNNIIALQAATEAEGKPARTVGGVSKKAAALLGRFAPTPKPAPAPLAQEPAISREQRDLGNEIKSVREAIEALRPQLTRAHLDGSAKLCELLRPQYGKLAARICAALVELGLAETAQREFTHKYRNVARSALRVIHGTGSLGDPRDYQSEIRRLLAFAAECGHYNLTDLPADWPGPRDTSNIRSWPLK